MTCLLSLADGINPQFGEPSGQKRCWNHACSNKTNSFVKRYHATFAVATSTGESFAFRSTRLSQRKVFGKRWMRSLPKRQLALVAVAVQDTIVEADCRLKQGQVAISRSISLHLFTPVDRPASPAMTMIWTQSEARVSGISINRKFNFLVYVWQTVRME